MTIKPRQPRRRHDVVTWGDLDDADFSFDGGDMDAPAENVAPVAHNRGRRSYNWPQVDPVLRFYIATSGSIYASKQDAFITMVREWCEREKWKVPGEGTIEKRIQLMKRQYFPAD